ncbi:MAG: ribosomal protein S18-alanine N-acetyltransferase [Acidobacteriota bacterium]
MGKGPDVRGAVRPMAARDLPEVSAIEADSFPNPWPLEALRHELMSNPFCSSFVVEQEGRVAGYAFLWVIFEQAHLINIAVGREFRRRGLGEALLVHALEQARSLGGERIHLEVRESNAPAIALYRKHGFGELGRIERYYSDGAPALVMEAPLTGGEGGGGR